MQSAQEPVDRQISLALDRDPRTAQAIIDVACIGSEVTLSGQVRSATEKAAAVEIAKSVASVAVVIDDLVVDAQAPRK